MTADGLTESERFPRRGDDGWPCADPLLVPVPMLGVHPTGHNTNPTPLVTGPTIRLMARNAKVRRDGYRKKQAS